MVKVPDIGQTEEERAILKLITNGNTGELKVARPKTNREDYITGRAAYVWRMVAFFVSDKPQHHCMPIMADMHLHQQDWDKRKEITKTLDDFVSRIVDAIPKKDWGGVRRWHQALHG